MRFNKFVLVPAFVLFAQAIVCTQVPLLNYLGYEFSFLTALVGGFLCGLLAIHHWKKDSPSSDVLYWTFLLRVLIQSLALIVIPFVVISLNAFFVKNCSFTQGFRLYVLYVVPSVIFCVSLGTFSSVIVRKHKKTLYVLLFLSVLAHIPIVTLTRPQIFAFNPIAGYFPGLTYDESIAGEARLLVYRVGTIAAALLLVTAGGVAVRTMNAEFERTAHHRWRIRYIAVATASAVICVGLYVLSDTIGLSSSVRFISKTLGGIRHTEHFNIIYPRNSVDDAKLRQLVILHEYLYDQLSEEWQVSPRKAITVFIYDSPQQKERLVGAAATDFTKPWLRQININRADVESALKHELVHAMLAERGVPLFQVAPNSGLIEGAAVATERYEYDESLHRLAAQIFALGIHPNVAEMFSLSGFFKSYPGVSYVLAGSFCRYLIDRYGLGSFKQLYRSGNFKHLYGRSLDTLVADWRSEINSIKPSHFELEKAAYLFKRSPVFGKECARVIANLNVQTRVLIGRKDYQAALASAEQSIMLSRSVDAVFQKSVALFHLGRFKEATEFMEGQFADSTIRFSLLPLRLTMGDSYWAAHDIESARKEYAIVLADSVSASLTEAAGTRLQVIDDSETRPLFEKYFLGEMRDSARIAFLESLKDNPKADPPARYLLGREYSVIGDDRRVVEELRVLAPMDSRVLEYLRNRRLARAMYNLGQYESAKLYAWRALNFVQDDAQLYQVGDFLQRCVWIDEHLRRD